eukprot:scaffold10626_cov112-Cylindrotheca_fusiformis.AAC.11
MNPVLFPRLRSFSSVVSASLSIHSSAVPKNHSQIQSLGRFRHLISHQSFDALVDPNRNIRQTILLVDGIHHSNLITSNPESLLESSQ